MDIISYLAHDRIRISYRPEWNSITGSTNATILLQQVFWRWIGNRGERFYKFLAPPKNPRPESLYQEGDSWLEELNISRHEFNSAVKKLEERDWPLIGHQTGFQKPDRLTFWWIDQENFEVSMRALYADSKIRIPDLSRGTKIRNPDLLHIVQRNNTKNKGRDLHLNEFPDSIKSHPEFLDMWEHFVNKVRKKGPTDRAVRMMVKEFPSPGVFIPSLKQSIKAGWTGLFPVAGPKARNDQISGGYSNDGFEDSTPKS